MKEVKDLNDIHKPKISKSSAIGLCVVITISLCWITYFFAWLISNKVTI